MKLANNLQIEQLLNTDWTNQFNQNQLYRIREGLNHNLDVSIYAKPELRSEHMREIVKGLKLGFDMAKYTSDEYTENQLRQIVFGLEKGLDVSIYAKKIHSAYLMNLARILLAAGAALESCVVADKLNRNKLLTVHQYYLRMKKVKGLNYHELRLLQMYPYKRDD